MARGMAHWCWAQLSRGDKAVCEVRGAKTAFLKSIGIQRHGISTLSLRHLGEACCSETAAAERAHQPIPNSHITAGVWQGCAAACLLHHPTDARDVEKVATISHWLNSLAPLEGLQADRAAVIGRHWRQFL